MSIEFLNRKDANEYAKRKNDEGFSTIIKRDPRRDWIYLVTITGKASPESITNLRKAIDLKEDESNIENVARSLSNRELLNLVNNKIDERRNYGVRNEVAESSGYVFSWSNTSKSWYPSGSKTKKGEIIKLDANEIFIPGINRVQALELAESNELKDLPLYGGSYEARERRELNFSGSELPPMLKQIHDDPELREKAEEFDPDLSEAFKEKDTEN